MKACATCASLGYGDLRCSDELQADIKLLNESSVHIAPHRQEGFTRETIHALAAIVRCFLQSLSDS